MITMGKRDVNAPNHWATLEKGFRITRPTVIFFGGNTTNDDRAANGNIKLVEKLLRRGSSRDIDLLSVKYESEILDERGHFVHGVKESIENYYKQYIRPILFDPKDRRKLKSERRIMRALQKMTFVGHCVGCSVINKIINLLEEDLIKLKRAGNKITNVENIISKIQVVAYAPHSEIIGNVNVLYITPYNDKDDTWQHPLYRMEGKKDIEFPRGFMKEYNKHFDIPGQVVQMAIENYGYAIVKRGQSVVVIPGPMSRYSDHAFTGMVDTKLLGAGSKNAKTAVALQSSLAKALDIFTQNSVKAVNDQHRGIEMRNIYDIFAEEFQGVGEGQRTSG